MLKTSSLEQFISRLPIQQQFKQSQKLLTKITPLWQQWCAKNLSEQSSTNQKSTISHFNNGELVISTPNAISATQIKHQKQSLLALFAQNDVTQIIKITVNINNAQQLNSTINQEQASFVPMSKKARKAAVDSINSCNKNITNQHLSETLQKLKNTLESL